MDAVRLCASCNQINFEALRNPLISDLPALREGLADSSRHPFKDKRDDAHKPTTLGTVKEINERSSTCQLCQLVGGLISRCNAGRLPELRITEHEICQAETSFFGIYRDPTGKNYWIRRLSIFVKDNYYVAGSPRRSLYFAFQACDIGATSVQVDNQFADPRPSIDMMVFGGRRRPSQVNLEWIRRWMGLCHTHHGVKCEKPYIDPSDDKSILIRFVDVRHRCIVTKPSVQISDCRYIALSYVWGGPQEFKLETSNADKMAAHGSLCRGIVPQTIEDAIHLTQSLGLQYLWVDALCIIQDDDTDKEVQIAAMSQIYGCSFVTLVAASAANVHGGLPGLRYGARLAEQKEIVVVPTTNADGNGKVVAGLSLMTTLQPLGSLTGHYLDHTVWNSRGWTMQERALSRRVLVFTQEQVYWVCREATFCEESYFENDLLRFNRFHDSALEQTLQHSFRNFYEPENEESRFWKSYQRLVAGYTRRTFSFQGDAFAAFLAVLQGLSSLSSEEFLWGLPRSHFEQSLLWNSFNQQQRREELSTLPMTSKKVRVPFPSWSWMGWIGETFIRIGDELFDSESGEIPEIVCFEHNHDPFRLEKVRQTTAAYESLEDRSRPAWKITHNQPITIADLVTEHPKLHLTELQQTPEMQVIFFWTSVALFILSPSGNDSNSYCDICDSRGNIVGSTRDIAMKDGKGGYDSPQQCEFAVIASRRNQFTKPMLLVLQIEWRNNFAYRVSYAEIAEDAWLRESHSWKLIPLR